MARVRTLPQCRLLSSFRVSDKNIDELVIQIDKSYKHINVLSLAEQLQKLGVKQNDITNIFRRIGIDDITISNIFDVIEEQKIKSTFGRLIELSVE
ncbi:MAG: hypothetical protein ACLQVL_29650 [Terriglobia bacterium]